MENSNNPAAFPALDLNNHEGHIRLELRNEGMSLRDYFAAKAMQGNLASCNPGFIQREHVDEMARTFYTMADAMLKQRTL